MLQLKLQQKKKLKKIKFAGFARMCVYERQRISSALDLPTSIDTKEMENFLDIKICIRFCFLLVTNCSEYEFLIQFEVSISWRLQASGHINLW